MQNINPWDQKRILSESFDMGCEGQNNGTRDQDEVCKVSLGAPILLVYKK